jgi:hypothetical protein
MTRPRNCPASEPIPGHRRPSTIVAILAALVTFFPGWHPAHADLTLAGPSGFVQAPSHTTIKAGQVEWAAHTRMYKVPGTAKERYLTHTALGFSPLRDLEVGVAKAIDSRRAAGDIDPDPTVNFKVRLPPVGSGEFAELAVGMVVDTNPNNYHTLYASLGGFGVGWNFGGNPGSGVANFGSYDRGRQEPRSLCLLVGAEYPTPVPGERGYRSHYFVDYNGDVFSVAWRFKSHRGFWIDAALHTKSSYTDFYNYRPLIIGVGAIF